MWNSSATFQNKSVTSHGARAAKTRADAGQCGSSEGEPLMMMPLLTRCDAARLLPAAPRGQPLQSRFGLGSPPTVNRPPRNFGCRCYGSTVANDRCVRVAAVGQQVFYPGRRTLRWPRSVLRCSVAESSAARCGTMGLEKVLRLLPCVVFFNAIQAQTGKLDL